MNVEKVILTKTDTGSSELKKIDFQSAFKASIDYFEGDELAANVFVNKYALKDSDGNIYEATPYDLHKRLAKRNSKN